MARDAKIADLMSAAESLLFVSDEPVSAAKIANILEVTPSLTDEVLQALRDEYMEEERGIQLREVAGGWRFYTHPANHELIERYVISWDTRKLSQAALEVLAIIAYHQPVTKQGVAAVRGVNSDSVISSLVEKGLVREAGRDKKGTNAVTYATSVTFLEKFGLKSIKDLPPLEDFAPDDESRELIRERLSGGVVDEHPSGNESDNPAEADMEDADSAVGEVAAGVDGNDAAAELASDGDTAAGGAAASADGAVRLAPDGDAATDDELTDAERQDDTIAAIYDDIAGDED